MRQAFDGSHRRRIHLFRHGDVSYVDDAGNRVADSRSVPLTDWGREQAAEMCAFMDGVEVDKIICSGLPRTVETASGIFGDRNIEIEVDPAFEEIRSYPNGYQNLQSLNEVAYAFAKAHEPGAAYAGGDIFAEVEARIVGAMKRVIADPSWKSLALVAHGGVNRALLGWATGAGLKSFATFEQNTCCVNIIDVDTHPESGDHQRTLIRGVNITAYDPAKRDVHLTALETIAERMSKKAGIKPHL
ncbi:MAG: phosphoglycerate mutase [Parvibaculum sp.]|jgi:probable phosphoglycerate mutase|nr:phosphoglycerate mutase [Parvibaculum sp.]|tara:strand:- start:227 stop:958 length:732 start_codon:yes stop_codon:yes gene_type:complete